MNKVNNTSDGSDGVSVAKIRSIKLFTYSATDFVDITAMVNYIEIFESIYSPFLTLNINITDANSLHSAFRMKGEEYVEVDIRGQDDKTGIRKQVFNVYEVADRIVSGNGSVVYTMKCVSPAALVDMNLKISQAFNGQPSDLVVDSFGKTLTIVDKQVFVEPTKNNVSYISNYWSPVQNIKYLCDRAVSKRNGAVTYLFFERKQEFRFESVDNMVVRDATNTFTYSLNTKDERERRAPGEQLPIMYNLYVDRMFNYIDRVMSGAYGNRALRVDPHTKSYSYEYYDFIESFNKYSRLNELPLGTELATRRINSVFRTAITPGKTYTDMPDDRSIEWYKQRPTELAALNATTIEFEAAGRFFIGAGDVINVAIPKVTASRQITGDDVKISSMLDTALSGRYLVTNLRHLIDRERHTIAVQASKDSYFKDTKK